MEICLFIDGEQLGLPIKNGGSFHGYVSHNQMVVVMNVQWYHLNDIFRWSFLCCPWNDTRNEDPKNWTSDRTVDRIW